VLLSFSEPAPTDCEMPRFGRGRRDRQARTTARFCIKASRLRELFSATRARLLRVLVERGVIEPVRNDDTGRTRCRPEARSGVSLYRRQAVDRSIKTQGRGGAQD
jgi:hypothetical protein